MKKNLRLLASVALVVTVVFGRDYLDDLDDVAVITAMGLIAIVWFIVWVQYEKQRTKKFKQVAEEIGFIFYPKDTFVRGDPSFALLRGFSAFDLFSQRPSPKIRNMLHSVSEQLEVGILEYQGRIGSEWSNRIVRQSVICFRSPELSLPQFSLRPEGLHHKIGSSLGYQDIDFESHRTGAEFSKKYLLQGKDERKVRELFTTEVLGFFEGQDGVSTEGGRSRLIFYRDGGRIKPEDVRPFMEEGLKVFRLFASSQPS